MLVGALVPAAAYALQAAPRRSRRAPCASPAPDAVPAASAPPPLRRRAVGAAAPPPPPAPSPVDPRRERTRPRRRRRSGCTSAVTATCSSPGTTTGANQNREGGAQRDSRLDFDTTRFVARARGRSALRDPLRGRGRVRARRHRRGPGARVRGVRRVRARGREGRRGHPRGALPQEGLRPLRASRSAASTSRSACSPLLPPHRLPRPPPAPRPRPRIIPSTWDEMGADGRGALRPDGGHRAGGQRPRLDGLQLAALGRARPPGDVRDRSAPPTWPASAASTSIRSTGSRSAPRSTTAAPRATGPSPTGEDCADARSRRGRALRLRRRAARSSPTCHTSFALAARARPGPRHVGPPRERRRHLGAQRPPVERARRRCARRSPNEACRAWGELGLDVAPWLGSAPTTGSSRSSASTTTTRCSRPRADLFDNPRFERTVFTGGVATSWPPAFFAKLDLSHRRFGSSDLRIRDDACGLGTGLRLLGSQETQMRTFGRSPSFSLSPCSRRSRRRRLRRRRRRHRRRGLRGPRDRRRLRRRGRHPDLRAPRRARRRARGGGRGPRRPTRARPT